MAMLPSNHSFAPQLLEGDVHVWLVRPDEVAGQDQQKLCESILSPGERERYQRFRFSTDRHLYLVSHAMLRRVLSFYADVPPADWQFTANQYERPEIMAPDLPFKLRFNLTHTRGLAACIVAAEVDVGIDAEEVTVRRDSMGIAKRMFSATEISALGNMDGETFQERFFTYWTLREAYGKACGSGLANADGQFHFVSDDDCCWEIRFEDMRGDPSHWQLSVLRLFDTYRVALAIQTGAGHSKNILTHQLDF